MKRLILSFLVMIAVSVLWSNQKTYSPFPIPPAFDDLNYGNEFLGGGHYQKNTGETGTYHSFIRTSGTILTAYHVFDGQSMSYDFNFSFNETGFFSLGITFYNYIESDIRSYHGEGYCINLVCHYNIPLADFGFVEETILFDETGNNISKVGSIHISSGPNSDGTTSYNITAWQDENVLVGILDVRK